MQGISFFFADDIHTHANIRPQLFLRFSRVLDILKNLFFSTIYIIEMLHLIIKASDI
jgi:hypothetical protein